MLCRGPARSSFVSCASFASVVHGASFGLGRGEGDGQLLQPIGLAVDSAGRVYVADWLRGQGRVHGFAPDGRLLGTWRSGTTASASGCRSGLGGRPDGRCHTLREKPPSEEGTTYYKRRD